MSEQYMSATEARDYLGVSSTRMWKFLRDKKLPYKVDPLNQRKKLIPVAELEALKVELGTLQEGK